jgi:hypothetical protein
MPTLRPASAVEILLESTNLMSYRRIWIGMVVPLGYSEGKSFC